MMGSTPVRVRIAPSPTGYLHLGTIRTALFNFLFARKEKGEFIIRIEDTDKERSLPIFEQDILDGMKALGLVWDEGPDVGGDFGPYRQSERKEIYRKEIEKLLDEKKAYWCFCTKEELEEQKQAMLSSGVFPKYAGVCRNLSQEEQEQKRKEGRSGVIRLVTPNHTHIEFTDMIRGKISVNSDMIGDFVIARSVDDPLYNFAVVVDDAHMKISHVIRGEDHISNTPKQLLIANALGVSEPKYVHLPLLLAPDRSKMSKRKMETSFNEYLKEGYLPEAIINFLALLGWHPDDDREILSLDEIVELFSLKRVQKGGAVFNVEKLDWFNAEYIKKLSLDELLEHLEHYVPEHWKEQKEIFQRALAVERPRLKKLSEFEAAARFFFERESYEPDLLIWNHLEKGAIIDNLQVVRALLDGVEEKDFTTQSLEGVLMPIAQERGKGDVLWPLRVALSGRKNSPSPFEILGVLGKKESLDRIDAAIEKLS